MKIGLRYKNKKFEIDVKSCKGARMGLGLMFKSKSAKALLFEFEKPNEMALTSLFVFFSFVAIFLDAKNKIVDLKVVRPFTPIVRSRKSFVKVVEIPINKRYKEITNIVVGN